MATKKLQILGSFGGASVQPDYNQNNSTAADYIKNRPFYSNLTEAELVDVNVAAAERGGWMKQSDETVDGTNYLWMAFLPITLEEGKQYSVAINENKYSSVATIESMYGSDLICFGDFDGYMSIEQSGDASEFTYLVIHDPTYGENGILYKGVEAPTNCKISSVEQEFVKIDHKYLPDNILTEETDPTVPDWAKEEVKPTYTASEVGAMPEILSGITGHFVRVKTVDDTGKPTEYETAEVNITVDSELNSESENPVQNKVVNTAIDSLNALVGDISVSEQINTAISAIPEQVQSDWNQADETSIDYIKNKTHCIESMNDVMNWDGNTSDRDSVAGILYWIDGQAKANILTNKVLKSSVITVCQELNGEKTYTSFLVSDLVGDFYKDFALISDLLLVTRKDNVVFNGIQIPQSGVYYARQESEDGLIYVSQLSYPEEVKTLDEIYIPETIARKDDFYHYTKGNLIHSTECTTTKSSESEIIAGFGFNAEFMSSLVLGKWYVVEFNGVEYVCKYSMNPYGADSEGFTSYYLGNMYMQHYGNWIANGDTEEEVITLLTTLGLQDTGEPFSINSYHYIYTKEAGTYTIRIYEANIAQIDEFYIPDTIARITDIPEQVQSDWNQIDETAVDYIKNKPDESDALEIVTEIGFIEPVAAADGSIYTDENGTVYTFN